MLVPILCFTCGCSIGDKEDLFIHLKNEKKEKEPDNEELDCSDILDILDIKNDCCRMHIITAINFVDYY